MKKVVGVVSSVAAVVILAGWGTPQSNVSGDKKHAINFFGSLETWANPGELMNIENISVDNLFKQIPMLLKPTLPLIMKRKMSAKNAAAQAAKAARDAARAAKKASGSEANAAKAATEAAKAAQKAAEAAACVAQAIADTTPNKKRGKFREHVLEGDPRTTLVEAKIDLAEVSELRVPHPNETWTYQKEKGYRKAEYLEIIVVSKDTKKTKTRYLIEKRKKVYCDRIIAAGPEEQEVPLEAIKSLKIKGYKDRKLEESKHKQIEERRKIIELKRTQHPAT